MPEAHATTWLVVPIAAPLMLSLAAFVLGGRWCARLGMAAVMIVVVSTCFITWNIWHRGPQTYPLGAWPAPLGIALYADGLSCALLGMSAVVGAFVSTYSLEYFPWPLGSDDEYRCGAVQFWPLWLLLWSALNALFLSRDVFNLYVTLELLTLASLGLVVIADTRLAVEAALRYLLAALVGSLLFLAGVALLYGEHGMLDIDSLAVEQAELLVGQASSRPAAESDGAMAQDERRTKSEPTAARLIPLVMIALGLMLKSALFPFHFWLPPAHGSAPAPVSALLSGLVVKGSFYILLRLWLDLFPAEVTRPVAMLPAVLGSAAIVWGSLQALAAERLKMLVAYSTVAQLGYLFLVFGLARPEVSSTAGFAESAWSAGVLFALSHALAKAALFLAAGTILHEAGHDRVRDLSGVSRRMPITFFAIGVAGVSLMGLPPSGAFVAKWLLLKASLSAGHAALAVVIVGGGLLAAGYLFRVLVAAFPGDGATTPGGEETRPIPLRPMRLKELTTLVLALASLLLGLAAAPVIELIEIGSPWSSAVVEEP